MSDDREAEALRAPIETGTLPSPQEATEAALLLDVLAGDPATTARWRFTTSDPHLWMASTVYNVTQRGLSGCPVWVRLFDGERGALAVLHAFNFPAEMELLVLADPGVLDRSALRFLASWAFDKVGGEGLRRVVIRVPAGAEQFQDYARRAGFKHEGTARDFFGDGADASVWAMTRADVRACRWFRRHSPDPASAPLPDLPRERMH